MKIAVLVVDRANYGRLRPLLHELENDDNVDLEIISSGTMPLERFGNAKNEVLSDGFNINHESFVEIEGSNPLTMAKSIGLSILENSTILSQMKPDFLVVIGDRYETLGVVIAAAYQNISIIHIQGGEVSGSIDECARHAISKFAHYHFPSTERARNYLIKMGERPDHVFNFGCPVVDVIHQNMGTNNFDIFNAGVGVEIDPNKDYNLIIYHPTTTEFSEKNNFSVLDIIEAVEHVGIPTVWLWPNIDAGSDKISKELRKFRENSKNKYIRFVKNFNPSDYQKILQNAKCAIGNSSSFLRDSSFVGTPVVLVGDRQHGREYAHNVTPVNCDKEEIIIAVKSQLEHGKYSPSTLYGKVGASKKIAKKITTLEPISKKFLNYIYE